MVKYIFLFLFSALLSCSPRLSKKTDYDTNKFKLWTSPNNLTWDDFAGKPLDSSLASEVYISNPSKIERNTLFHPVTLDVKTLLDRQKSWVKKDQANDILLKYNQTIFNIYELHTRKLKSDFLKTDFGIKNPVDIYYKLVNSINDKLYKMVMKFRTESKMGKDKNVVENWYNKINEQLLELNQFK